MFDLVCLWMLLLTTMIMVLPCISCNHLCSNFTVLRYYILNFYIIIIMLLPILYIYHKIKVFHHVLFNTFRGDMVDYFVYLLYYLVN